MNVLKDSVEKIEGINSARRQEDIAKRVLIVAGVMIPSGIPPIFAGGNSLVKIICDIISWINK